MNKHFFVFYRKKMSFSSAITVENRLFLRQQKSKAE